MPQLWYSVLALITPGVFWAELVNRCKKINSPVRRHEEKSQYLIRGPASKVGMSCSSPCTSVLRSAVVGHTVFCIASEP